MEAYGSSQDRNNSGLRVESAPAVAGSSIPQPKLSLQDLARLFLSLSGSREQWDAVAGSAFSAGIGSGAGSLPGLAVPVPVAAPSACSSVCVPTLGGGLPLMLLPRPIRLVGGGALGSPPALSGAAGARLAGRGPSRGRSVAGVGLLPLPALLVWLAFPPPLRPLLRMQAYRKA